MSKDGKELGGVAGFKGRLDVKVIRAKTKPWYVRLWSYLFDRRTNL